MPYPLSKPVDNAENKTQGAGITTMYYVSTAVDGNLTKALKRIRRRLATKRWEIDGNGRIRCELLPPVENHPRRMCSPLGMLAVDAPGTRLYRTLLEPSNAKWKTIVESFVDFEIRDHIHALANQADRSHRREYMEQDLVRLAIGLAVTTAPSDRASESILAMEPATIRILSDAAHHPNSHAGILLTRALRTESNTLAQDFREHFRQTVEEAAAASHSANAINRHRLRRLTADAKNGNTGIDRNASAGERPARARGVVRRAMRHLRRAAGLLWATARDSMRPMGANEVPAGHTGSRRGSS